LEGDDLAGSLPWFAAALGEGDRSAMPAGRRDPQRTRLGAAWRQLPRLSQLWHRAPGHDRAQFGPDGKWVVTATSGHPGDKQARAWVWDTERRRVLNERTLSEGVVNYLAVSPDQQNPFIVVCLSKADGKGEVRLWDPVGGTEFRGEHEQGPVNYASFSADGRY